VLLVKIADRICNTSDFISLKGKFYAWHYLHSADCLLPALQEFAGDPAVEKALKAWEKLDRSLSKSARREAILGCMAGGAVGDALGAPVEFLDRESIFRKYGPTGVTGYVEYAGGRGRITDDTQMALFTAEGILRAQVRGAERGICHGASVVKGAYQRWLTTQGETSSDSAESLESGWLIKEKKLFAVRAPGMTCLSALRQNTLKASNSSKGCGTVMRMAPAGLFFEPEEAYRYGCEFSAITHGHPAGITAGGAFAMLISLLCSGKSLDDSLEQLERHLLSDPAAAETLEALRKARRAQDISELGEGWVAEEALAIGVYCALHCTWDFRAGVLAAVNITGDSDSAGSVAGNILGVLNGEKAIPEEWRKNLREYAIVRKTALDLNKRFEGDDEENSTEKWFRKYPGF
jgi:ADP-ribosylglycohydrolase